MPVLSSELGHDHASEDGRDRTARVQGAATLRTTAEESVADGAARIVSHRAAWEAGNGEDGYLTGLDNMIDIFEGLLDDSSVS